MPTEIGLVRLRELLSNPLTQLVEVLPVNEYDEEHLPGAISMPLKSLNRHSASQLEPARPVIVYCWDDG